MIHDGNCYHVATQWLNLLWPSGSVTWRKKQFDIPVLAFWCCSQERIQITSGQSPLAKGSHMDPLKVVTGIHLIISFGLCWLKRLGNVGKQKAWLVSLILLGTYSCVFSLKSFSLITSPGWLLLAILFSASVTISAKISTHLTITIVPLSCSNLLQCYFLFPLFLVFQLCIW